MADSVPGRDRDCMKRSGLCRPRTQESSQRHPYARAQPVNRSLQVSRRSERQSVECTLAAKNHLVQPAACTTFVKAVQCAPGGSIPSIAPASARENWTMAVRRERNDRGGKDVLLSTQAVTAGARRW